MSQPKDSREVLNWAGAIMAVLVMVLFGYVIFVLSIREIPTTNKDLMYAVVTGLIGLVTIAFGFFFGSSHQTKKQSDTIDTLSKAAATPTISAHPGDTIRTETSSETRVE